MFVILNLCIACVTMALAWHSAGEPLYVFATGYLCAVFVERAWGLAFPDWPHVRLWPRP